MQALVLEVDPNDYDDTDAVHTVRNLPDWWALLRERDDRRVLDSFEVELADVLRRFAERLGRVELDPLGASATRRVADLRHRTGLLTASERAALDEALVSGLGVISRAGRVLHSGSPTVSGTLAQINISGGGTPKREVPSAAVGRRGLEGDRQAERKHHGRPWQAVSVWSAEVIDGLAAHGHPIAPGAAGENLTLRGLDWSKVSPGVQLAIGDALVIELAMWALPCKTIAACFSDRRFDRIHHDRGPVSRIYASVVRPGPVRKGDPVRTLG